MDPLQRMRKISAAALLAGCGLSVGCHEHGVAVRPPQPLGTRINEIFQTQEENAEAAKYVIYMHEFELNEPPRAGRARGWRLNDYGEDHVKQIAVNIKRGDAYPIVVERNQTSAKQDTEYKYPVHFNEELDRQRRDVVVAALEALGVPDAQALVVVAPAAAEGYSGVEAARTYQQGLNQQGFGGSFGGGGFGGGFGGFGGFF